MNELAGRTTSQTIVEASYLSKVYWDGSRSLTVFEDINFKLFCPGSMAILGPSGSGKTTLLNVLSGLDQASRGRVELAGVDLSTLSSQKMAMFRARHIGFVFQFYHLLPELTALENVLIALWVDSSRVVATRQAYARASELLAKVGLSQRASHYPSQLSGGEQQRVAIARALAADPAVIFCDEPTGNLDADNARMIGDILVELYEKDAKTLMIATHDQRLAERMPWIFDLMKKDWIKKPE